MSRSRGNPIANAQPAGRIDACAYASTYPGTFSAPGAARSAPATVRGAGAASYLASQCESCVTESWHSNKPASESESCVTENCQSKTQCITIRTLRHSKLQLQQDKCAHARREYSPRRAGRGVLSAPRRRARGYLAHASAVRFIGDAGSIARGEAGGGGT